MMWKTSIVLFAVAWSYCVKPPSDDWYAHQDRRIKLPDFDGTEPTGVVDGVVLQAINVAAEDFLGPVSKPRPCSDTRAAQIYYVIRRDDIIFVRITEDPAACGCQGYSLDSSGRYAISTDGRILRRALDAEPYWVEGEDAGPPRGEVIEIPPNPDGGMPVWPEVPITMNPEYLPPWERDGGMADPFPDAGFNPLHKRRWPPWRCDPSEMGTPRDAGTAADAGTPRDAGTAR